MAKLSPEFIRHREERNAQEAALGLRGYGRKKVDDALAEIEEALKDVVHPSVRNPYDERTGLLDLLNDVVDRVGQYEEIPGDRAAMDALEEFALAVGIAFELGMAAVLGEADPAKAAKARTARKAQRQSGADHGGTAKQEDAAAWQKKATPTYLKLRARYKKEKAPALARRISGKLVPEGVELPADLRIARWIRAMDTVTPTYLELRERFPAESADDIADRMIGKLGDAQEDGPEVARWVRMMDEAQRRQGPSDFQARAPRGS